MKPPRLILVRGSNDVASAVAHLLFRSGYPVVLQDSPLPTVTRRKMAFADAIFDGRAMLEGVEAVRVEQLAKLSGLLESPTCIPIVVQDFKQTLEAVRPQVLVDARMRKHSQPEKQIGLAPLAIGLGPSFIAGKTVDLAVETGWGESLGNVVIEGATDPLMGEPNSIAGHSRDRYVYAPCAGIFEAALQIGDHVIQGQVIAHIGEIQLRAPISGSLRGLTHTKVPVEMNTKVIEVDPRAEAPQISGLADRPMKIAQGVLRAIRLGTGTVPKETKEQSLGET